MRLDREQLRKSICYYFFGRNLANLDRSPLNLLPNLKLMNIDVPELRSKLGRFAGEEVDGLMVIALDREFLIRIVSEINRIKKSSLLGGRFG